MREEDELSWKIFLDFWEGAADDFENQAMDEGDIEEQWNTFFKSFGNLPYPDKLTYQQYYQLKSILQTAFAQARKNHNKELQEQKYKLLKQKLEHQKAITETWKERSKLIWILIVLGFKITNWVKRNE